MRLVYVIIITIFTLFQTKGSYSHPINADLTLRKIKINSDFKGVDVLIFGALDVKGKLIIVVHGPKRSLAINKKEKKYGLWVNGKREKIDDVKQFYAITSTDELSKITNEEGLNSIRISDLSFGENKELNEAFKQMKMNKKLYFESIKSVGLINDKLFRSNIKLPGNIPQGRYVIEILLFYNHRLFGIQTIPLLVSNVGIESFIFDMHYMHPIGYAIFAITIALFIGWISSLVKKINRNKEKR
ncbi:MAG: TIGR02186 family protein [Rickettsiaceae bacterium H1]|nr:TIGR02186 family protein [Rickettsiaceae bacterium H1]